MAREQIEGWHFTVEFVEIPQDRAEWLRGFLRRHGYAVPLWCANLSVQQFSSDDEKGASASMLARPDYRDAWLKLFRPWLLAPEDERERLLMHELAHILNGKLVDTAERVLAHAYREPGPFGTFSKDILLQETEGCTEDTARALMLAYEAGRRSNLYHPARAEGTGVAQQVV